MAASNAKAATFQDDFNDGNADGWWLGYSLAVPSVYGNWRVEDWMLVQDLGYDGTLALVNDFQITDQTVETQLKLNGPSGGGGITIWFQDNSNGVFVVVSNGAIGVSEIVNGTWYYTIYPYNFSINENRWVDLKVEANSTTGELNVYADGVYKFTHQLNTLQSIGQSGLITGNAGGYFDNFSITSDSIVYFPTDKSECKRGGWKIFNNPIFMNQGSCVSYIVSGE